MSRLFFTFLLMITFWNQNNELKAQKENGQDDRLPAVAGKFYPATEKELRDTLNLLFLKARPRVVDDVRAVICPHAGYIFSGEIAASAVNQIDPDRKYDNVFIIASSHQVSFEGASVYNAGNYVTPLGVVPVNTEIANSLIGSSRTFIFRKDADLTEHSTEVQVPFLQFHLKKPFQLVPIVIGTQTESTCKKLAEVLKPYFNEHNLFVISTDFSHYPSANDAKIADKATCDAILSGSTENLLKVIENYKSRSIPNLMTNLCGWTSVTTLLEILKGQKNYKIFPIEYKNSGDSPYGDKNQVVGYWAITVSYSEGLFNFTDNEKISLMKMARHAIFHTVSKVPLDEISPDTVPDNLKVESGAFVTLKKNGQLRGCIGRFTSEIYLYQLVREMAVAAAIQDSRFQPVTQDELESLEIEISILSPLKKISSVSEIIPGKHGIYIRKGSASGTFLPQVATEYNWNTEEFLGHCAKDKAGIGWDGWKTADIWTYEAYIFSENDFTGSKD